MNLHFDANRALTISVWIQLILCVPLIAFADLDLHPILVEYIESYDEISDPNVLWLYIMLAVFLVYSASLVGLLLENRWAKTAYLFVIVPTLLINLYFDLHYAATIYHPLEALTFDVDWIITGFVAAILLLTDVRLEKPTQKLKIILLTIAFWLLLLLCMLFVVA